MFKPEVSAAVDVLYLLADENSKRLESKTVFNIYNFVCGLLVFKLIMKYILTCSLPYVMQISLIFCESKQETYISSKNVILCLKYVSLSSSTKLSIFELLLTSFSNRVLDLKTLP